MRSLRRLLAIAVTVFTTTLVFGQFAAGAASLTITLPGGIVPAPPPAINTFILEGGVLPLSFTVTNPAGNGPATLTTLNVGNVPNLLLDRTDVVMKTNPGGNCAVGFVLAATANCSITLSLTTNADGIPENKDAGLSTITVTAGSAATGLTNVPFNVEVDDVAAVSEPSTATLLGLAVLAAVASSRTLRQRGVKIGT